MVSDDFFERLSDRAYHQKPGVEVTPRADDSSSELGGVSQ